MLLSRETTEAAPVDVACGVIYCWSVNSDGTINRYRIADWQLSGTFPVGTGSTAIALDGSYEPWIINAADVYKR
jgi:hypothetical protein